MGLQQGPNHALEKTEHCCLKYFIVKIMIQKAWFPTTNNIPGFVLKNVRKNAPLK